MITPDTLRAVDREYRDLVLSLRALASLLHDPDPNAPADPDTAWEPVLANILDAELNQLAVLMGDITAALRVESDAPGPLGRVDLARVLSSAVRRTGCRVLARVEEPVPVQAHREIVSQAVASAISLALRVAGGRVTAAAKRAGKDGAVTVTIPIGDSPNWSRWDARVGLLRRIVAAEGGKVSMERRGVKAAILTLSFPAADLAREHRPASA
ncbi:MAG: hypothetical protein ACRDJM_10140 [Actinomycetota bacterium]